MAVMWIDPQQLLPPVKAGCKHISEDVLVLFDHGFESVAVYDHAIGEWIDLDSMSCITRKVIGWRGIYENINARRPLRDTQNLCYEDSVGHGLMEEYQSMSGPELCKALVERIGKELLEAYEAASANKEHYAEELADIVIMCLVAAARNDIDLADAIEKKRIANVYREWRHEGNEQH